MKNPIYDGDFKERPEQIVAILNFVSDNLDRNPTLSVGIKTITHNRAKMPIVPHDVVVIEMVDGNDVFSFDLTPKFAKAFAGKMIEFAEKLEQ